MTEPGAGRTEDAAFAAGLTEFFRVRQLAIHEVTPSAAGRYTLWVEGEDGQAVTRVVELLAEIPQLVAYRYHATSEAVLELYTMGAELPSGGRGLHRLPGQAETDGSRGADGVARD